MNSKFETYFLKLPILIQNIFITLYGLKLNRIQRKGVYHSVKIEIRDHLRFSEAEILNYQTEMLKRIITEASLQVPFFRDLFLNNHINPNDIKNINDLVKIPILEKKTIKKNTDQFINLRYRKKSLININTSGTTGMPLKIFCDSPTRQKNYAFFDRFLENVGINSVGKRATFGGRIIVNSDQMEPPFWRYSYFQKNLLFSSYHLLERNIPSYINKLRNFRPEYIDAYPSSLYLLAKYAYDRDIDLNGITKAIVTSAEQLQPEHRRIIEFVFNAPIYDQYGCAEMCIFVAQCKNGKYHIHNDYGILEFITEDGKPAKPGERAELICTGLINSVMPFIRYRIGDMGILSKGQCICGSPFPVMDELIGRSDDFIITPCGKRVSRMGRVFYNFPIKEVQYVQKAIESLEVYIVKDHEYTQKTEEMARLELKKRLGSEINIEIKYVDYIKRGPNGKLKTVISHLE